MPLEEGKMASQPQEPFFWQTAENRRPSNQPFITVPTWAAMSSRASFGEP